MQQAIYNTIRIQATNRRTNTEAPRTQGLPRRVARRLDLAGVLALMGSSAAYGVFALAHSGL